VHHKTNPDYSILAELDRPITRPRTSFGYLFCLFLVTGAMLVLPVIYLGFVGFLSWAVYHHAVYNWQPIMKFGGFTGGLYLILAKFMVYFIPLLAGIVVVFFMFKPLLAGQPRRAQPLALNPSDNPLLYAFIAKICDAVGAPTPQRIDMDCNLNASAGFRRGFRSMLGNDLVLTIGLPMVASFSTRELAGVIAHEFGHFTQGAGMRLSYIIRTINMWFVRVAYQRDAWDEALEDWSHEVEDGRVAMVVWSVQIAVWFSRLFLKLLLYTGHIIAGFMLRQMEYDADAHQTKVVGSETFETTMRKLATLSAALDITYRQIRARWKKSGHLPDNLSELLRQTHQDLPPETLQKIDDELGFHRTGLFDSHPAPADRIRRARQANEPGIFHDDRPATSLFASFEHPARFVTLLHYTENLGIPITEKTLLRVESKQSKEALGYATATDPADEFFMGLLPLMLPLRIELPAPSVDLEADLAEFHQICEGLEPVAAQVRPMASQYREYAQKWLDARAAARLIEWGLAIDPKTFGLMDGNLATAKALEQEAQAERESLRDSLREVTSALNRKCQLALAIRLAGGGDGGAEPISPGHVTKLVEQLNQLADDFGKREDAMDALTVLNHIKSIRQSTGETPAISRAMEAQNALVDSFVASTNGTAEIAPKIGLQLQVNRRLGQTAESAVEGLQKRTLQWFTDYQNSIRELAKVALEVGQPAI